jgi:hypothetical protein
VVARQVLCHWSHSFRSSSLYTQIDDL